MRKQIVIGTSGHIDHGKTSLIKALTGVDTDRLKEEKQRGITIELGFAHLDLSDGKSISFVDVPGHEKFIHNMLSGVSGMDAVLLIIAADEGIKPQTIEHLKILSALGVFTGAVIITKSDLVDQDKIEYLRQEIVEFTDQTLFMNQPIFDVSVFDALSLKPLMNYLNGLFDQMTNDKKDLSSRLSIDRVFTLTGQGTIITGTLIEGTINKNEMLFLYPKLEKIRVRNIQVHGHDVESAIAGQRVALNLPLEKHLIHRGQVLSSSEQIPVTMMIDVKLVIDDEEKNKLEHWQRIRLHHGTTEIFGRLVIKPNDFEKDHRVQIRLETPLICKVSDRFVIRNYSPLYFIGGGFIINTHAQKSIISSLDNHRHDESLVENHLLAINTLFKIDKTLFEQFPIPFEKCLKIMDEMIEKRQLIRVDSSHFLSFDFYEKISMKAIEAISLFHENNGLKMGMPKEQLRNTLKIKEKQTLDAILSQLNGDNHINITGNLVALKTFKIRYSLAQQAQMDKILLQVITSGFKPSSIRELTTQVSLKKNDYDIFINLINTRILVKISEDTVMYCDNYDIVAKKLKAYLQQNGEISVATFRDLLEISRKSSLEILEHFDGIKLTKRLDDKRILLKQ